MKLSSFERNHWYGAACLLLFLWVTLPPGSAAAQTPDDSSAWSVRLGGGFIVSPDYTGSDDYETKPVPLIDVSHPSGFFIRYPHGIGFNVIRREGLTAGVAVGYGGGRDNDGDLAPLEEVDAGALANLFADYRLGPVSIGVTLSSPVSGDTEGEQVSLGVRYRSMLTERLFYTAGAQLKWNSDDWNESLFSLTADEAARLGIAPFAAGGGASEAGLGGTLTYAWTKRWSVTAVAGVSQLIGDAADSPIVEDLGDATQLTGGLLLGYEFSGRHK
ncbi:MAG: MipA/OmpV family protein [Gammaproteobacteria bacterium]|nr:MipA/OmpV family protein [Gammaproteobacteria bacterium]